MQKLLLIATFFLFYNKASAQPTTISIGAVADNTIYETPNTNSNALGQNIFSGTNGGASPRRGLLKFDIAAAVPAGSVITAVTLTLNCNLSRSQSDSVFLHRLTATWGEGTSNAGAGGGDGAGVPATTNDATWLTRFFSSTNWSTPGGDFVSMASASKSINAVGFYSWSSVAMVADVQNWLDVPANNAGWILLCNETAAATARKFGSRENTTTANRPSLSITYTSVIPVILTTFSATVNNNTVSLNWETAQEINNSHFEILQSNNGNTFTKIASVQGNGTSSLKHTYHFTQLLSTAGKYFYQLAQVDYNGRKTMSAIIPVNIISITSKYKPISNLVTNNIIVNNTTTVQNIDYRIYNIEGLLLVKNKLVSNSITVSNFSTGTYYLIIGNRNELPEKYLFIKQ